MALHRRYLTESYKIFTEYATITDVSTNGLRPSVFHIELHNIYCICHNHRQLYSVGNITDGTTDGMNPSIYFQHEFFFLRVFFVCKTIGFFLPTEIATENDITDERYSDERIPWVM